MYHLMALLLTLFCIGSVHADSICPPTVAPGGYDFFLPCIPQKPMPPDLGPAVYFEQRATNLSDAAKAILGRQADVLRRHPSLTIELIGFADIEEAPTYIQKAELGGNRALAARAYLIEKGIDADRLIVIGRDYAPLIPRVVDAKTLAAMRFVYSKTRDP